jgi:hypothetical protein
LFRERVDSPRSQIQRTNRRSLVPRARGLTVRPAEFVSERASGKTYRFYRCTTRDKYGKDKCRTQPLPARVLEDFVVERITAATADETLTESVRKTLTARIETERATMTKLRTALSDQLADASTAASKLADSMARLDGHARELVEAKLRIEADRLADAERQLGTLERDVVELDQAVHEVEWIVGALTNFGRVWSNMTPTT